MYALSQAKLKLFAGLHYKRQRRKHQLYLAEGRKLLSAARAAGAPIAAVVVAEGVALEEALPPGVPCYEAPPRAFQRLSSMDHPEGVLTVLQMPAPSETGPPQTPTLLLYEVNDPGNLGTLLRTAAWFGFPALYCSSGTVDCYNPKVVRSSMGGLFRVGVVYLEDFSAFVCYHSNQIAAAAPGGLAPETGVFRQRPMLLMGNESHGLPSELLNPPKLQRVTIGGAGGVESLNVSTAGSILAHQLYVQRT